MVLLVFTPPVGDCVNQTDCAVGFIAHFLATISPVFVFNLYCGYVCNVTDNKT